MNDGQIEDLDISTQIAEHLKSAVEKSLGSMTGSNFRVDVEKAGPAAEMTGKITWEQAISPGPARLCISAGRDLWTTAGRLTLAAAGIDSVTDEDCESTWEEIVSQIAVGFCNLLSRDIKIELKPGKADLRDREPAGLSWTVFTASCDEGSWQLRAGWPNDLAELFDRPEAPPSGQVRPADPTHSKTFDLLLDVALPVCVSFGRTSLEIREVLKLTTGSIVELNRFMAEPVDVIVNDCVIARGEVVVINGNYGVRITQLSSREDRMKTGMAEAPARHGAGVR